MSDPKKSTENSEKKTDNIENKEVRNADKSGYTYSAGSVTNALLKGEIGKYDAELESKNITDERKGKVTKGLFNKHYSAFSIYR